MSLSGAERRHRPCSGSHGEALTLTCGRLSSRDLLATGPCLEKNSCLPERNLGVYLPSPPSPGHPSPIECNLLFHTLLSQPDNIPLHRFKSVSINLHARVLFDGAFAFAPNGMGMAGNHVGSSPWCWRKSIYRCL